MCTVAKLPDCFRSSRLSKYIGLSGTVLVSVDFPFAEFVTIRRGIFTHRELVIAIFLNINRIFSCSVQWICEYHFSTAAVLVKEQSTIKYHANVIWNGLNDNMIHSFTNSHFEPAGTKCFSHGQSACGDGHALIFGNRCYRNSSCNFQVTQDIR